MKKILIQTLKISGFFALGILLLYLAFKGIALKELWAILREANFWWIGVSLFFLTLSFFSRARRWMLLIEPLNHTPTFRNTFFSMMVGYLANYALPRLGEVTRCVTLGRKEKIPIDSLVGTVIVERMFDLVMLMIILLILLFTWLDKFGGFFRDQVFGPFRDSIEQTFGGTLGFWLLIASVVLVILGGLFYFRKRLLRIGPIRKAWDIIKGIGEGLKSVYKMKRKWEFIFHSVFIWFCYIMMTWILVFSFVETSHLSFIDGIFLLVLGGIAFTVPVTGGFGAYHFLISRAIHLVYGLSLELGGAYAILTHEPNTFFTVLLGGISFAIIVSSRKRKDTQNA